MPSGLLLNPCSRLQKNVEDLPPIAGKSSMPSSMFSWVAFNGVCCPVPSLHGRQCIYVFHQWSKDHTLEWLNAHLRAHVRGSEGKRSRPTAAILDSQSVKSDPHGGQVGYDAGKRIKGRKRHLLVDRLGMLLEVCVSPASTGDRCGAKKLLEGTLGELGVLGWLRKLWVDRGYSGEGFSNRVKERQAKLEVEVVKPTGEARGFQVQVHRWKVERTIGWLMQGRRMVRDYEKTETSAKAWIYLRMIDLQIRRLA